jgi:hypothetical protein
MQSEATWPVAKHLAQAAEFEGPSRTERPFSPKFELEFVNLVTTESLGIREIFNDCIISE